MDNKTVLYRKIKDGEIGDFKVIEVNSDHAMCVYVDKADISAKLHYSTISSRDIIPSEFVAVGDVFRGRVINRERGMVLIITSVIDLKENRKKFKSKNIAESWMNNGTP